MYQKGILYPSINSRTSVLGRLRDYLRLLMKRSVGLCVQVWSSISGACPGPLPCQHQPLLIDTANIYGSCCTMHIDPVRVRKYLWTILYSVRTYHCLCYKSAQTFMVHTSCPIHVVKKSISILPSAHRHR